MKTAEKLVLVLTFVLLIAGVFVALRYLDFLDVKEIETTVHGPVSKVSIEMQRILNPLKGRNIFEVNLRSLKKTLLSFDGVSEVEVRRYYPNKLILDITYSDVSIKCYSFQEDGTVLFYFCHDGILEQVGQETWDAFDMLTVVELYPAYAQKTVKWGCDEGFILMVNLTEHLTENNLITSMKYDNNNGDDFGRLVIDLPSLNSTLYVRELVSENRLSEALDFISSQFSAGGADVIYDLYADKLVKRT